MLAASGVADEPRQATRISAMYLVDLGMNISRYLSNKLHDSGLRRQSLFAVARLFSGL